MVATSRDAETGQAFSMLLQDWRRLRGKTQLDLAMDAQVSQRHVSFLERGRSRPSQAMVVALAEALDLPFRERNDLLLAAGFAPAYEESSISAPAMLQVRRALEMILSQQEPYPAVVMDRYWDLLMSNRSAQGLFGRMVNLAALPTPANLLRLMFDPGLVRPYVDNWEQVARLLLARLRNEAVRGFIDSRLRSLLDDLRRFPGYPTEGALEGSTAYGPLVPVEFSVDSMHFSFFSTVTSLGAPHDVTAQ